MSNVRECLILAAGNGTRIRAASGFRPKPLLGRVIQIEDLLDAGIDRQDYVSRGQRLIQEEPRRARFEYMVRRIGTHIVDIGKGISNYDALDTGMFLCSPTLFETLGSVMKNGDCSLSGGMRRLAAERRFHAFDIGNAEWQDVDTPEALAHAEAMFAGAPVGLYSAAGNEATGGVRT